MKILKSACLFATALNFAATLFYCAQRTSGRQLLSMATNGCVFILLLVSILAGFCFLSREKIRAFVPALICFIGLPTSLFLGVYLGRTISDSRFQKNLPRYTAVVQLVEKGEIKPSLEDPRIALPNEYADLAWATFSKSNSDGLTIEFMTESGFPVKHSGYLYVSSGNIEGDTNTLRRWPYRSRINTNWFYISD